MDFRVGDDASLFIVVVAGGLGLGRCVATWTSVAVDLDIVVEDIDRSMLKQKEYGKCSYKGKI